MPQLCPTHHTPLLTGIRPEVRGAINKYVNLIRNKPKREYALAYVRWLDGGAVGEAPESGPRLSYMGAQSVRLTIAEFHPWGLT